MADWFDVPLNSIDAFEKATKLSVCVHELSGVLWPFLPPHRYLHNNPACAAAKAHDLPACVRFDVTAVRGAMAEQPEGRIHVCHAGVVEWVVPMIREGMLQRVLFAGQRRPGASLQCVQPLPVAIKEPWAHHLRALDPVDDDEAAWILELLRQLAARLDQWQLNTPQAAIREPAQRGSRGNRAARTLRDDLTRRQYLIHNFIQGRHTKPIMLTDLARILHLSESRAGHAVKQACGQSFLELLLQARLRTAAGLLRHTGLSVLEVARESGFRNPSHFHQMFKRHFGTTPHQFRRHSEVSRESSPPEAS